MLDDLERRLLRECANFMGVYVLLLQGNKTLIYMNQTEVNSTDWGYNITTIINASFWTESDDPMIVPCKMTCELTSDTSYVIYR